MNASILCTLLAQRINPTYFWLSGLEIIWLMETRLPPIENEVSPYDTPENRAIVADVIANYTTLEAAYLAEQQAAHDAEEARKAAKAQAFLDNLPSWAQVDQAVTNISNLADAKAFIRKLARITYWLARDQQN